MTGQSVRWPYVVEIVAHQEINGRVARVAIPVSVEMLDDDTASVWPYLRRQIDDKFNQAAAVEPIGVGRLVVLLGLVCVSVPVAEVEAWTVEQRAAAEEWACAAVMAASDHDDITVPPRPDFLPAKRWDPFA